MKAKDPDVEVLYDLDRYRVLLKDGIFHAQVRRGSSHKHTTMARFDSNPEETMKETLTRVLEWLL